MQIKMAQLRKKYVKPKYIPVWNIVEAETVVHFGFRLEDVQYSIVVTTYVEGQTAHLLRDASKEIIRQRAINGVRGTRKLNAEQQEVVWNAFLEEVNHFMIVVLESRGK